MNEFKENDGIKISEIVNLLRKIAGDTESFKDNILKSIKSPSEFIKKPTAVALSYINGKYILALKPYGNYRLNAQGVIEAKPTKNEDGDPSIANKLLSKNYDILNSALLELTSKPPRYFVGYAHPGGYMNSIIEENGTTFRIWGCVIEFEQPGTNTRIQYRISERKIKATILGIDVEFEEDDENYKNVVVQILEIVIPKEKLPEIVKCNLETQSLLKGRVK